MRKVKDEIIKRTLILTVTSLLIFFFLSLYLTSNSNRKNLEENLIAISTIVNGEIEKTQTEQEMLDIVNKYTANQEYINIVITNSYGAFIIDSTSDSEVVSGKLTDDEIKKADNEIKQNRIYVKDNKIYFITRINEDILVRTSLAIRSEANFVLMSAFYMLLLITLVIVVGIIYTRRTSDMVVKAFHDISNNLNTINKGEYLVLDANHKFSEVNEAIDEINKINANIYSYIQKISLERDKVNFIVDNMEQGLVIASASGEVLLVNNAALDILGKEKDIKKLGDLFTESTARRILNIDNNMFFDYYLDEKEKIYELIISIINKAWNENESGHLLFISIIDVTEDRKKDEMKADFISSASHELKTPITSISGFSELLLDSYDSITKEKALSYLTKIHNEALNMRNTIDELLYLSNLENKTTKSELVEDVHLDAVIDDIYNNYQEKVRKASLTLTKNVFPVCITGSNILIRQLIINLVDNAIKYNKDNGSIDISLVDSGEDVILKVSDTGIGIEEKDYDKIFARLFDCRSYRANDDFKWN